MPTFRKQKIDAIVENAMEVSLTFRGGSVDILELGVKNIVDGRRGIYGGNLQDYRRSSGN